jgi:hypothetical protein
LCYNKAGNVLQMIQFDHWKGILNLNAGERVDRLAKEGSKMYQKHSSSVALIILVLLRVDPGS